MRGRWRIVCAGLAATALGLAGCSHKSVAEGENSPGMVVEVTVTHVAVADISKTISVSGTVAALPNQDVRVTSLVPGRIVRMLVAEGEPVEKGQELAEIDARSLRDQLQQAEAAVQQAQANLQNARLARARNENLFQRGITAQKDMEDARTQESVAQASLQQAQAALSFARLQLSRTTVRSPIRGVVVRRIATLGEQVDGTAAQPIFEVANPQPVELLGNVPAIYLAKIRVGESLPISSDDFPGQTFTGRVVAVSPAVDPITNLGLVRIRIANTRRLLRLGMFLTVQVPIEIHRQALTVPPEALYHNEQGQTEVHRVEGNVAIAVPVQVGIETRDRVELLGGVHAGETVVLTGGYGLGERTEIKFKP